MKKTFIVTGSVTLFALFFQVSPLIGISSDIIGAMFLLSPFLLTFMAWYIIKFGKPSTHTFEERFYDDWDYLRNGKEDSSD